MIGITEINKLISKEVKVSDTQVKKITMAFLEVAKQKLTSGEDIIFKNYFSLTRSKKTSSEISKFCPKHVAAVNNYKQNNKGKGINGFSKSPVWRKLMTEMKSCSGCQDQKQKIVKSTKLLPRVNCKVGKGFWKTT